MHDFAFVFRPTRPLSPEELPTRNNAARQWAIDHQKAGVVKGAHPFESGGALVGKDGTSPIEPEGAVASVLIIQAADLDSAIELAKGHPGLAYGTQIEVRQVKAVAPAPR